MTIVFACGGTGGHINPAIAIAKYIQERHKEAKIIFVGLDQEMDARLIEREGFEFYGFYFVGFNRKINPTNIKNLFKGFSNIRKVKKLLKKIDPDVVVGTGGYASFPAVYCGNKLKIPTVIHESNAYPGLTTKMLAKRADSIMLAFKEAGKDLPHKERHIVCGMPVRESIIFSDKRSCRSQLGLDAEAPMLLSVGGSLGARVFNEKIARFIAMTAKSQTFIHYHSTGKFGYGWFPDLLKEYGIDEAKLPKLFVKEYIYDMPSVLGASDLCICRCGASTLSELAAQGKPSILIPSPNVSENHQYKNALVFEKNGAAVVIEEKDVTPEKLRQVVDELLFDKQKLQKMSESALQLAVLDANERIYKVIMRHVKNGALL